MNENEISQTNQAPPGSNQYEFALRPNYFDGQLLNALDFQTEQQYARGKLQSTLVNLYGWGIARGLDVEWYSDSGILSVSTGMALDRAGRIIVLKESVRVSLPKQTGVRFLYLTIRYTERETDYCRFEGEEALQFVQGYTRVTELAQLDLLPEAPGDNADELVLAKLDISGERVVGVDLNARRYTRLIAGDIEAKRIDFLTTEDLPTGLKIDAWQRDGREGLVVHAPETHFDGKLTVRESVRIGAPDSLSQAVDVKLPATQLLVNAAGGAAAIFGTNAPLTVSGDGPHLGFNATHDGLNWRGVTGENAMARISLDPVGGDLSFGTAPARTRAGDLAAIPDRMRISPDGSVMIDATPPVPAGRLIVGGPGGTAAIFGGANSLTTVFDAPGLGFNAYRENDDWKSISPGKSAGRLCFENDGIVFGVLEGDPAAAAGVAIQLRQRARIDKKGFEVHGDLSVSGNVMTATSGVITGSRWQSIRPRVEAGNVLLGDSHFAKPQKFALPKEVPPEAVEVLVYAYIALRNNEKDQSVEFCFYSEEAPNQFAHYLFLRNFETHPNKSWKDWLENKPVFWHSASDNFWLPVTALRELNAIVAWYPKNVPLSAGEAMLFVTGWR